MLVWADARKKWTPAASFPRFPAPAPEPDFPRLSSACSKTLVFTMFATTIVEKPRLYKLCVLAAESSKRHAFEKRQCLSPFYFLVSTTKNMSIWRNKIVHPHSPVWKVNFQRGEIIIIEIFWFFDGFGGIWREFKDSLRGVWAKSGNSGFSAGNPNLSKRVRDP